MPGMIMQWVLFLGGVFAVLFAFGVFDTAN